MYQTVVNLFSVCYSQLCVSWSNLSATCRNVSCVANNHNDISVTFSSEVLGRSDGGNRLLVSYFRLY